MDLQNQRHMLALSRKALWIHTSSLVLSRESQPFSKLQFCTLLPPALAIVPTCVWSCQNTYSGPAGAGAWNLHPGFSLKWTHKGSQLFAALPEPRGHCKVSQDSCCRAALCLRVVPLLKFTLKKQNSPHQSNFLFTSLAENASVLPSIWKPQMHQLGSLLQVKLFSFLTAANR